MHYRCLDSLFNIATSPVSDVSKKIVLRINLSWVLIIRRPIGKPLHVLTASLAMIMLNIRQKAENEFCFFVWFANCTGHVSSVEKIAVNLLFFADASQSPAELGRLPSRAGWALIAVKLKYYIYRQEKKSGLWLYSLPCDWYDANLYALDMTIFE